MTDYRGSRARGVTGAQAELLQLVKELGSPTVRALRNHGERFQRNESWKASVGSYSSRVKLLVDNGDLRREAGMISLTEQGEAALEQANSRGN
jgi:hypothetical protein